ncbi:MAG: asparagine synthase (glutamine-hydrolyzing) [Gaiellales bacterium]|nr:asparagine synthase (glutamine-hydrolyzing) [Gaiellales bacterium]
MCGICGIYHHRDQEAVAPPILEAMIATMVHRGPDDSGRHVDGPAGLGMRRLSIIDLEGGAQPMPNEDGRLWAMCNGEIYNFRDLRRELEGLGHEFRTRSDTEVIVHAYEQWGFGSLARLNGMFGLALWDSRDRSLLLARDPFGIKPLYYRDVAGTLLFGSEIRAILAYPGVPRSVDLQAVDQYLDLTYIPSPRTAFQGISKLPPGHALLCAPGGTTLKRFSAPPATEQLREPEPVVIERLRQGIEAAVKRQMVADVPIGVMLSGGVDSSAVATIMARAASAPIETFTVGFSGDFAGNELEEARATAKRLGARHHEVIISAEEFADFLPRSIWFLEEPVATSSTLAFYKVCALAREYVKVVLTGQGADEPFAGYPRHAGEYYGRFYRALPAGLRTRVVEPALLRLPRNERLKRAARSLGETETRARHAAVYSTMDPEVRRRLWREQPVPAAGSWSMPGWDDDVRHLDGLSRMLFVDTRTSLPDNLLLYGDKMSMSVSLEARVPFLDVDLMRVVESIPSHLKIKGRTQKYILKKAVAAWIPQSTITRKKMGFVTPVDQWFRGEWRERMYGLLLASDSACAQFFRPGIMRQMLDEHERGVHDHKRALFSLLTFELWYQQFIRPGSWPPPPAAL